MHLHRLPIKRVLVLWSVSAVIALLCTVGLLMSVPTDREAPPPPVEHAMRAEVLCRIPSTADTVLPDSIVSSRPQLRLKETPNGQYELHYWGNPIRPEYAFSIRRYNTHTSLLRTPQGKVQKWLPLPVTVPRRADKQLPLQPPVPIPPFPGSADTFFTARISVHDAATGAVLCSEIYLLHGAK